MQLLPHPLRKPKVKAAALGKQEDFAADVCVCVRVCVRVCVSESVYVFDPRVGMLRLELECAPELVWFSELRCRRRKSRSGSGSMERCQP